MRGPAAGLVCADPVTRTPMHRHKWKLYFFPKTAHTWDNFYSTFEYNSTIDVQCTCLVWQFLSWFEEQWFFGVENSCVCGCFRHQKYNRKQFEKSLKWNQSWSKRELVESVWKHFESKVSSDNNLQVEDSLLEEISLFKIWFGDVVWGYEWGGLTYHLPCDQLVHHHLLQGDPDPHHILEPLWAAVREDDLSNF